MLVNGITMTHDDDNRFAVTTCHWRSNSRWVFGLVSEWVGKLQVSNRSQQRWKNRYKKAVSLMQAESLNPSLRGSTVRSIPRIFGSWTILVSEFCAKQFRSWATVTSFTRWVRYSSVGYYLLRVFYHWRRITLRFFPCWSIVHYCHSRCWLLSWSSSFSENSK